MAETPAGANAPTANNIKDIIKKVPTPVWLAIGGVTIGLAYAAWRDRNTPDVVETEGNTGESELGYAEVDYGVSSPIIPPSVQPNYPDSGETVGAVGQTALETLLAGQQSMFDTLLGWIENQQPAPLPASGPPPPASPAEPPGTPQQTPPPSAGRRRNKPAHYNAGSVARNPSGTVSLARPGASGWIVIPDNSREFALFNFSFPNGKTERWIKWGTGKHVPRNKRGKARKQGEGKWDPTK